MTTAVRVRPALKNGDPGYDLVPQRFQTSRVEVTSEQQIAVEAPNGRKLFVFDRVFGEDVDQEGVFDYVQESVTSFVEGYNVSILAYGQSGAGKSFTMGTTGYEDQAKPHIKGIIPRAAEELFEQLEGPSRAPGSGIKAPSRFSGLGPAQSIHSKSSPNKNYQLRATYVEVGTPTPFGRRSVANLNRSTTSSFAISSSHRILQTTSDKPSSFAKTPKVASFSRVSHSVPSTPRMICCRH